MKSINDYEEITGFTNIDELHIRLHQFKFDNPDKKGYAEFNGFLFFTDDEDLTIDHLYQTICGESKAEHLNKRCHLRMEATAREIKYKMIKAERISSFIKSGLRNLPPKHHEKWIDIVPIRVMDMYHGLDLENFLELYENLQIETFETVKECFIEQGHSGGSGFLVLSMLKEFSPKGADFVKFMGY
jgi:hypothetical protein